MSAEESIDIDTKADFDRAVAIAAEQETLGGAGGA
jgi:CMP-N-acetylneuraminic acid synthetase